MYVCMYIHIFWHSIRHSFWHILWHSFWHSIWHIFWHTFWHICWHSCWHSIWHLFWHSMWHLFWHSLWHGHWDLELAVEVRHCQLRSAIGGRRKEGRREGGREVTLIKSRDPCLAGGEQYTLTYFFWHWSKRMVEGLQIGWGWGAPCLIYICFLIFTYSKCFATNSTRNMLWLGDSFSSLRSMVARVRAEHRHTWHWAQPTYVEPRAHLAPHGPVQTGTNSKCLQGIVLSRNIVSIFCLQRTFCLKPGTDGRLQWWDWHWLALRVQQKIWEYPRPKRAASAGPTRAPGGKGPPVRERPERPERPAPKQRAAPKGGTNGCTRGRFGSEMIRTKSEQL